MSKEKINLGDTYKSQDYEKVPYEEADEAYDLTGPIGFHGFSCERWTPRFRKKKPLSNNEKNDNLKK